MEKIVFNKNFYPTPNHLISRMWLKCKRQPRNILEPSAGKGDIVDYLKEKNKYHARNIKIRCIEIEPDLQSLLRGKNYDVIDSDFLQYTGNDQFDLIIANPPFNEGDKHLLKAIEIMYSGEIVFLLNAETLKNPYSNTRKMLVEKLKELNADIEYIQDAFLDAERKTNVEVALVYINIERNYETDFFNGCNDNTKEHIIEIKDKNEVTSSSMIEAYVEDYNDKIKTRLEFLRMYFQNYKKLNFALDIGPKTGSFKEIVIETVNQMLETTRKSFWKKILEFKEVKSRMTEKKIKEFNLLIEKQSSMEFAENNIRQFILNLIGSYEDVLNEAVEEIFDLMTTKHAHNDDCKKNIHYFNGWKTNKSFYVNKKVVLPVYLNCGIHPFFDWSGVLHLDRHGTSWFNDIDKVMNYFDGKSEYVSIQEAIILAFENNQMKNIKSTYFTINLYKKRTIHLTFNDEDIRRRFNIVACKGKNWIPRDYGKKLYIEMTSEERAVVDEFEGRNNYEKNLGKIGYSERNLKMIET